MSLNQSRANGVCLCACRRTLLNPPGQW